MPIASNLSGVRFGRLTAVEDTGRCVRGRIWRCVCDCGTEKLVVSQALRSGHTKSCGCLQPDAARESGVKRRTHGHTTRESKDSASEYFIWSSMKARCANPKNASYKRYGARGIDVCDRWLSSYEDFFNDMGARPSKEHSLDRIDTNKGYFPENCRWADKFQQAETRTNVRRIDVSGRVMTAAAWSREYGVPAMAIRNRIDAGWSAEDAVMKPIRGKNASRPS